jgi:hypothetical protein
MSKQKEAREVRRHVAERMKDVQPFKVVPSRKGLATVYTLCAVLGYLSGVVLFLVRHR